MPVAPDPTWSHRSRRLFGTLVHAHHEADAGTLRVILLAWFGAAGFPLYYWVFTELFPQPYEDFTARAVGTAIGLLGFIAVRLDRFWRRLYTTFAVMYFLPFFCTYMFVMNGGSQIWAQCLLVALVALFQFEHRVALPAWLAGTACAVLCVIARQRGALLLTYEVLEQLPVHAFLITTLSAMRMGRNAMERQKLSGLREGLGTVAHEMRTPLASVDANVRGLTRLLRDADCDIAPQRDQVKLAMSRIQYEVRYMNHLIDMFLVNASTPLSRLGPIETVSMANAVHAALRRYPFSDPSHAAKVSIEVRRNFRFPGQEELAVVVLLNLLRNAMKAIEHAGKGRVRIVVDGGNTTPRLLFIDTACGIAARRMPLIFQRFYTHPPHKGNGIGLGLGLALCHQIMHAWHAKIRCVSRESAYAIFVLEFPRSGAQ
jgi:two-component system CAI-1 autoinducer sensor kinase/phosphatase CqsS